MAILGYDTIGGLSGALDWRNMRLTKDTATETGWITSVTFRTQKVIGEADYLGDVAIYDAATMAPIPHSYDSGALVQITNQNWHWLTYTYTGILPVIYAGESYYIGVAAGGGDKFSMSIQHDVDAGLGGRDYRSDGDFNRVITIEADEDLRLSLYATYTPFAGPQGTFTHVGALINADIEAVGVTGFDDVQDISGLTKA